MWRRQASGDGTATKEKSVAGRTRALSALDDLLRRADWEGLADVERAELLRPHSALQAPAAAPAASDAAGASNRALADWVAQLVAPCFQPEAVGVVRGWLEGAAPDAHLYVGGRVGQGRTSLVASLARQAMAGRPAAPDYCYVPLPSALSRASLLALPRGTGARFTKALSAAAGEICQNWDEAAKASTADSTQPNPLMQLISGQLGPVEAAAPAPAGDYLKQLRAAIEALTASGDTPPFCGDDTPIGHVAVDSDDASGATAPGAPVVIGALSQSNMTSTLLRANGGVLILLAADVMAADGAWPALTAALRAQALTLKAGWPPIPLAVHVVLIGSGDAYQTLYSASDDLRRLFRYEVWCNSITDWTREAEATYAALADGAARRYGLPAFDPTGVARLVEEGSRRAGGLNRLHVVTDLLLLRDLAVDAAQTARMRNATATTGADVEAALQLRRKLQAVNARRVRESILTGQEITPTTGSEIGQINGLGIYEFHPSEGDFAIPTRISATVSPGREERLLDIEREAEQADSDHVRGALTMEGYLARRYGQQRPLSVAARMRFEQEHGTTSGDSASAALLFALLSALAQVPIRYSLAITGAVGQYGEMQPIGGVNLKIEGFWELCRERRAHGEQSEGGYGVLIPAVNARDLMLRPEVAQSIAQEGWFHVWPISTVDEGLTLLTGLPAAEVHQRVEQRLQHFHEAMQRDRAAR